MDFLLALEQHDRWGNKRIVLDCNAKNAKNILVEHVRKVHLGRRTYHYMLSGLVSIASIWFCLIYDQNAILFFIWWSKNVIHQKYLFDIEVIQRYVDSEKINF